MQPKIEYELKRSKRKTIGLKITSEAKLVIHAPWRVPKYYIEELIEKKRSWIQKHLNKQKVRKPQAFEPTEGQSVNVFGRPHHLTFTNTSKPFVNQQSLVLPRKGQPEKHLKTLLKQELWQYLQTQVPLSASQMGLSYNQFKITNAKRRLGSCNTRKNLCFSLQNAHLPKEMINYIIVHELAHLQEMNHSPKFWKIVASYYPDYKSAKKWIRENLHLSLSLS